MFNSLAGSRGGGGILYMCMSVNTFVYLCKFRNIYNVTTNQLIEETLVVMVMGLAERSTGQRRLFCTILYGLNLLQICIFDKVIIYKIQ